MSPQSSPAPTIVHINDLLRQVRRQRSRTQDTGRTARLELLDRQLRMGHRGLEVTISGRNKWR